DIWQIRRIYLHPSSRYHPPGGRPTYQPQPSPGRTRSNLLLGALATAHATRLSLARTEAVRLDSLKNLVQGFLVKGRVLHKSLVRLLAKKLKHHVVNSGVRTTHTLNVQVLHAYASRHLLRHRENVSVKLEYVDHLDVALFNLRGGQLNGFRHSLSFKKVQILLTRPLPAH